MTTLTDKQKRFVEEYLVDLNATRAAIAAGYSEKTAHSIGHENLKKPDIDEAIQKAMAERSERTKITQDKVLAEYARLSFSNMQDYLRIDDEGEGTLTLAELDEDQARAISEYTVETHNERDPEDNKKTRVVRKTKLKLYDKKGALDSVARHLGMFNDKVTLGGNVVVKRSIERPGD